MKVKNDVLMMIQEAMNIGVKQGADFSELRLLAYNTAAHVESGIAGLEKAGDMIRLLTAIGAENGDFMTLLSKCISNDNKIDCGELETIEKEGFEAVIAIISLIRWARYKARTQEDVHQV